MMCVAPVSRTILRLITAIIVPLLSAAGAWAQPAEEVSTRPAAAGTGAAAPAKAGWRVMPLRSELEFKAGKVGGEALQHLHGLARSVSNPDVIYLSHDCAQFWRSRDNGTTWRKCLGIGCPVHASQSIEVDPVDSNIVVAVLESAYDYLVADFEGLYRSTDGGDHWQFVLKTESSQQRFYQHNIAWDASSKAAGGARRWYAGFPHNALFRSEDGGVKWDKVADLKEHDPLYAVQTHPTDGKTVYLASARGLFVSRSRGAYLLPLGDLPAGAVTAVMVHPKDINRVYAVVKGKGLYESANGGAKFTLLKEWDAVWFFQNSAHPEVVYLLGQKNESVVSRDAGRTWNPVRVTPPLGWPGGWQNKIAGEFSGVLPDPRDAGGAVAYSRARLWRTGDGGRNWVDSSTLFTGYAWGFGGGGVAFDPADPDHFTLFCFDAGPVVTENGGKWFERRSVPGGWHSQKRISWTGAYRGEYQPVKGSKTIVATIGYYHDARLMRSTDDGHTWQLVDEPNGHYYFVGFHTKDANLVFSEAVRSFDAGATWQAIPYLRERRAEIAGLCRSRPDTLYALGKSRKEIFRSDDRGDTWRPYAKVDWAFSGLSSLPTFAVDPRDANKVYTLGRDRDLAVFDGAEWRSMGVLKLAGGREFRNYIHSVVFDPRRPEIVYAGAATVGLPCVFRNLNGGKDWEDITGNLPRSSRGGLLVNPHTGELMHGGVFGTWVYPPPYESPRAMYPRLAVPAAK